MVEQVTDLFPYVAIFVLLMWTALAVTSLIDAWFIRQNDFFRISTMITIAFQVCIENMFAFLSFYTVSNEGLVYEIGTGLNQ